MIDDAAWARLARHLAGEERPDEAAATRDWIESDPERRAAFDAMLPAWNASATAPRTWDADAAWKSMTRRSPSRGIRFHPERRPSRGHWWTLGLVSATAVAAALLVMLRAEPPARSVEKRDAVGEREYRTAAGQRAVVNLVDGTRVELGVDSRLRVRDWTGSHRDVFLVGEAAFTVVHDSTRPFNVYARNAVVNDLGTRFGIRAYDDADPVRVVVTSGEVSVADSLHRSVALLRAGDNASLSNEGELALERRSDTTTLLAWTRDRFAVRETSLRDVARQLERWFDVRIDIRDSVAAAHRVTIDMPATRLNDILGAATTPLGLIYEQNGRTVVIRRPNNQNEPDPSRRSEQ